MTTLKTANPNALLFTTVDDASLLASAPTLTAGLLNNANYVWNTTSLTWVKMTQASGGGGGLVQIQDSSGNNLNSTSGSLNVNITGGGGSGSNAAAGLTGSAVPTSADYLGFNSSGNLIGVSAANPLPVSVSGGGSNAAAGTTGSAVPSSASYTSWNSGGNNTGVSLTTALPIQAGTGATFPVTGTFYQATQPVSIASMPSTPVTGTFWPTTQPVSGTVAATQSGTWNIGSITTLPSLPTGANTIGAVNINGTVPVSGTFWQATQPVSGTVTTTPPANASSNITQFGGVSLSTGTGVSGTGIPRVTVSSDSFPASQAVTGTFWQATQPVSGSVTATVASTTVTNTVAENLSQVAGTALGATAIVNYGSTPAAVAVPGVNAFVTNAGSIGGGTQYTAGTVQATQIGTVSLGFDGTDVRALSTTSNGYLNVNATVSGGNAAAGLTGSAVPTSADYSGFNDGTGHLIGTSPTTPLPISVNAANFIFSSLNSTSTQLASGATFTGTIETAVSQPEISLLLTSDQPITLTVNQFIDSGGVYAVQPIIFFINAGIEFSRSFPINGNYLQLSVKNTGLATTTTLNLNTAYGTINSADASGNTPVSAAENSIVGSITTTQSVSIPTVGYSTIGIDISGTWTGAITPEVTINGTIWYPIEFVDTGGGLLGTTFAANNLAQCNAAGMSQFRVRGNSVTSGTANIILRASAMPAVVALNESLPQGANQIGSVAQSGTWNIGSITTMPTTPVTGTFYQATQPVSLATNTPTLQSGSTTAVTQATGTNLHTVVDSGTITTVGTLSAITAGPAIASGFYSRITDGVSVGAVKAASTAAVAADPAQVVAISPNNTVGVTNATLTKGTQGATGVTVQELKDAGRNQTNYFMAAQVVSTATEALQSMTGYKGGIAVAATTTPAVVTAAKTYRIQRITITYVGIATAGAIQVNLRANLSGVALVTSPLVDSWIIGEQQAATAAVAGGTTTVQIDIPDGLEFAAGTGIGITVLGIGATGTAAITGYAKISVGGYEY